MSSETAIRTGEEKNEVKSQCLYIPPHTHVRALCVVLWSCLIAVSGEYSTRTSLR